MEILAGFLIAAAIALTGVGGGVLTTPVLLLSAGLGARESVGTALLFATAVKLLALPVYVRRRQVNFRVLGYLAAGGIPAVVAGAALLGRVSNWGRVVAAIGAIIAATSLLSLWRLLWGPAEAPNRNRLGWLSAVGAGIGIEVGFSSAGAGALGALALLRLTSLEAAEVVGTDIMFGFLLSLVGGGFHFAAGAFDGPVLLKLLAGGVFGSLAGAQLAGRIPHRAARIVLLVALVAVGCQLCYRGIVGVG